jgi:hypothetical protein
MQLVILCLVMMMKFLMCIEYYAVCGSIVRNYVRKECELNKASPLKKISFSHQSAEDFAQMWEKCEQKRF